MIARRFMTIVVVVYLGLASPGALKGQMGNASLSGTIRDESGAVIPGVEVTVTNTATGVSKQTLTTTAGIYVITDLIPGSYRLKAVAKGFESEVVASVQLQVDQQAAVDLTLKVGSLNQEVTVTGTTLPLLETQSAAVGTVIGNTQVESIPLNGRYFTQLLELLPGTVPSAPQGQTAEYVGSTQRNQMPVFDVNGQSGAYTMYRIDGIDNAEHNFGGAAIPLSPDAIQEFKLETSNFTAQYGRSPVQVEVVSKAGTNQFHGDTYEFVRNDVFDSDQWSFTGPHSPLYLKRNQFGGTLGGPIRKDKLFFFASYDGTRQTLTAPQTATVPSGSMRAGTFPEGEVIFDPATGLPFANNTVPTSSFNSIAVNVLNVLPAPNLAGVAQYNSAGLLLPPISNYFYDPRQTQTINQYNARGDYTMSQRDSVSVRYTYSSNNLFSEGPTAPGVPGIVGAQGETLGGQNLGAAWTHNFGPSIVNQVLFGLLANPDTYSKVVNAETPSAATLGMAGFLAPNAYTGMPQFTIGGVTLSSGNYRPLQYGDTDYLLLDNVTIVRGSHTIQFGGSLQRTVLQEADGEVSDGRFSFNGAQTRNRLTPGSPTTPCTAEGSAVCAAGDPMADFLLGDLASAGRGTPIPFMPKYFSVWSGYVEDTWQARPDLTFSLGMRYDYNTRFHTGGAHPDYYSTPIIQNGLFTGMVAVANNSSGQISKDALPDALAAYPGVVESCRTAGLPSNCMISEKHDWQPRFGFAWKMTPATVLRGGFGMFYGYLEGYVETEQGDQWPMVEFLQTQTYTEPPTGTQPPPLSLSNPFSTAAATAPFFNNNGAPYRGLPAAYEWNLTAQRAISSDTTLTVGYVASVSRHLENAANNQGFCCWFNIPSPIGVVLGPNQSQAPPDPQFGAMTLYEDTGNASYESLQVGVERRPTHGLGFTASYTYGKNLYIQPGLTDPRYPKNDRGPFDDNLTNDFILSPIWQLPFGAGERWANVHGPLNLLVGGWKLSAVITIRSGFPFTPTLDGTDLLSMNGYNNFDVPDRVPGCSLATHSLGNWFNKSCFTLPNEPTAPGALLREGNAGINELVGPSAWSVDMGLSKFFQLNERFKLEFRAESFNLFNHPMFGQPNSLIEPGGNSGPAVISSVISQPRIIQLAMKVHF